MHHTYLITPARKKQRGMSLIEVLVSLIIISIGILGISKMQALAIANTQVSSGRGLIALQAASIGAIMHDNKGYWQVNNPGTPPCNTSGACAFTGSSTTYFGTPSASCSYSTQCVGQAMTAYEMGTRLTNLNRVAPTYTLNINCTNTAGPTSCIIEISWLEKQTGGNASTASVAAAQSTVTQYYYLYVQP